MRTPREKKLILKYWIYGTIGALLLGSGLSVLLHGSDLLRAGDDWWFWVSTGGFALIMAGLSFIVDANRFRSFADVLRELDKRAGT